MTTVEQPNKRQKVNKAFLYAFMQTQTDGTLHEFHLSDAFLTKEDANVAMKEFYNRELSCVNDEECEDSDKAFEMLYYVCEDIAKHGESATCAFKMVDILDEDIKSGFVFSVVSLDCYGKEIFFHISPVFPTKDAALLDIQSYYNEKFPDGYEMEKCEDPKLALECLKNGCKTLNDYDEIAYCLLREVTIK